MHARSSDESLKYQMIRPFADIEKIERFIFLFLESKAFIGPPIGGGAFASTPGRPLFARTD
jgi:hypothetical protein